MDTELEDVQLVIRPENLIVKDKHESTRDNYFEGTVEVATYLGSTVRYDIKVGEHNLLVDTVFESGDKIFTKGSEIKVIVDPERVLLL